MPKMFKIIKGLESLSLEMERIPLGIMILLIIAMILFTVCYPFFITKTHLNTLKKEKYRKICLILSVFICFSFVLIITLMNRETGDTTLIKLKPLNGLFDRKNLYQDIAGNIANFYLFIPIGMICLGMFKGDFRVLKCCGIGLTGSLIIESIQLVGRIGVFDIDDIIFNTVGTLCGCLFMMLLKMKHHRYESVGLFSNIAAAMLLCGLLFPVIVFGGYHILRLYGKQEIQSENTSQIPSITSKEGATDGDTILYNGKEYWYNSDNITVLLMATREETDCEQLDSLALLTVNPVHKQIYIVEIPNNIVVESTGGNIDDNMMLSNKTLKQIYVNTSSEKEKYQNVVNAVSMLFYDIPINGYISFSVNELRSICSLVGNFSVITEENLVIADEIIYADMPIEIDSNTIAEDFTWKKDVIEPGDTSRIVRHTEILSELLQRYYFYLDNEDIVFTGYQFMSDLKNRVETSLDTGVLTCLLTELSKLDIQDAQIIMVLDRDSSRGSTEDFYVKNDSMYKLVLYEYYLRDYSE